MIVIRNHQQHLDLDRKRYKNTSLQRKNEFLKSVLDGVLWIYVRSQKFLLTDNQMLPTSEYTSQKWQQDLLMQSFLVYLTFMQSNLR